MAAIEWQPDQGWLLLERSDSAYPVELLDGNFVSTWMIILRFRRGRFSRRHLILLADNTDVNELRRLRIHLRHPPKKG